MKRTLPQVSRPGQLLQATPSDTTLYTIPQSAVHFSPERTITFTRVIANKGNIGLLWNTIIPIPCADVMRRRPNPDPRNIYVCALDVELVPTGPSKNEPLNIALLMGAAMGEADDMWTTLPTNQTHMFRMPTAVLSRLSNNEDLITQTIVSGSSSIDEIHRAMTACHLRRHCTAQTMFFLRPPMSMKPIALIAQMLSLVPTDMLIGMDAARVFREYVSLRTATDYADAETAGCIAVPLFRRVKSPDPAMHDTFMMTSFGFWIRALQDIYEENRQNVLPGPAESYAPGIGTCVVAGTDGPAAMQTATIIAPRSMVAHLYASLLSHLAEEATARFQQVDRANQSFALLFKTDGPIMNALASFTLTYRHVVVENHLLVRESVDVPDDVFAGRSDVASAQWY